MFEGSEDFRSYFFDDYGDIIITGYVFNHCYSINNNKGRSLYIKQDNDATIHNTIFNYIHTTNLTGGAILAAKSIDDKYTEYANENMKNLDIQYYCFQNCFGD